MPQFIGQRVAQAPTSTTAEHITRLGDTISEGLIKRKEKQALLQIGQAYQQGNLPAAQAAAFQYGRPDIGMQIGRQRSAADARAQAQSNWEQTFGLQQAAGGRAAEKHRVDMSQKHAMIDYYKSMMSPQQGAVVAPGGAPSFAPGAPATVGAAPPVAQGGASPTYDRNTEAIIGMMEGPKAAHDYRYKGQKLGIDMRKEQRDIAKNPHNLGEGDLAVDKAFARDHYTPWVTGGFTDTQKQMKELKSVVQMLRPKSKGGKGMDVSGGFTRAMMPESLLPVFDAGAANAYDLVAGVTQRNLRTILGAQFTEKEGAALIRRAYNLGLEEEHNLPRVERLFDQIRTAGQQKAAAVNYYKKHGTLKGFSGKIPSMNDFAPDRLYPEDIPGNPQPGHVQDGYRYKGGPLDQKSSWEPV